MLRATAKRTTDWLVQGGSISEADREVYEFGLDKLFSMLSNLIFTAVIGLLFGMFVQMIAFYSAYIALRVYAGGYHADRQLRCFFISIGIVIPCLLAIHYQQVWNVPVVFFGLLAAGVVILALLGPVGNKNKMPDELEKTVYRRRLLRNLVIITTGAVILSMLALQDYAAAVLCGVLLSTATAIVGKVKLLLQA